MTSSCFYEGTVRHRRVEPRSEFRYPLALAYIDLDELPGLMGGQLVRSGFGPLRFERSDYLGDPNHDLAESVRKEVRDATGGAPAGPVRVLTQLRSFGTCFNPVSFYYCFDADAIRVEAIVAEVTNTPWGERHAYVVAGERGERRRGRVLEGHFAKALHVSPLMGMDHDYICRAAEPGETLSVHIESTHRTEGRAFDATLSMRRRAMDRAGAVRMSVRYPLASVRVLALIYAQALRLKLAGAPYFPHPQGGSE